MLLFAGTVLTSGSAVHGADDDHTFRSGWFTWKPYIHQERMHGIDQVRGLDVELTRNVFRRAGYQLNLVDRFDWSVLLERVESGEHDVLISAHRTNEREEYAYFSEPYRTERTSLFLPPGSSSSYEFQSVRGMVDMFESRDFRLGVIEDFSHGNERLDHYVDSEQARDNVREFDREIDLLDALRRGEIDGFLNYQLPTQTVAWNHGLLDDVEEYPVTVSESGIHVMFSKETTSPEQVSEFNQALRDFKSSGDYYYLVKEYLLPLLLSMTTEQQWFFIVDLVGTIAFSISGIVLARKENYDIFGAYALAAMPALGGGITRDLLVGRRPLAVLQTPAYILAVFFTVTVAFLVVAFLDRRGEKDDFENSFFSRRSFNVIVEIGDAIGLSAFTIIGVGVAVKMNTQPLWMWGPLLACVTGAGGGIIRDTVRSASHTPSLKGEIYPEIALGWGLLFSGVMILQTWRLNPNEIFLAVLVCLVGAFLTRIVVIYKNLKSPFF